MKRRNSLINLFAISFAVLVMLCLSIFSNVAIKSSALDASGKCGDNVVYKYNSSKKELIISGSGPMYQSVTVFKQCDVEKITVEKGVTSISSWLFEKCEKLEEVYISDTVTQIGGCVFNDCVLLEKIVVDKNNPAYSSDSRGVLYDKEKTVIIQYPVGRYEVYNMPDSVVEIRQYAFYNCKAEGIYFSESLKSIGASGFAFCDNLKTVELPDSLEKINDFAFGGCKSLEKVVLSDGCQSLGVSCFQDCEKLSYIYLGKSLKTIPLGCFLGCCFESFEFPDSITSVQDYAFKKCIYLENVKLSENLSYIGVDAFYDTDIRKIIIPEKVKIICDGAFSNCNNLSEFVILSSDCDINGVFDWGYSYVHLTIYVDKDAKAYEYANEISDGVHVSVKNVAHKYKTKVITKATTSKNGKVKKTCSECGKQVSVVVPKIKSVKLSKTTYTYDKNIKTPSVTVKDDKGNKLKKDTDYTVTYSNGRKAVGTYKVTVVFKGKYSGNKTLSFKIVLGQVKSVKQNTNKKGLYVSWNKVTGATGYQVYELQPNGKWEKLITTKNNWLHNSSVKFKVTWKIRAYYKDKNGKVHYGAFSDKMTFKGVK